MPEQLGFGFDQIAEEPRTSHLPSTMESASPFYRGLMEKHHAAMLAGDVDAAMAIRKEEQDLAIKLNGGELLGIAGGPGSPVDQLERATDAPAGTVALMGTARRIHAYRWGIMPSEDRAGRHFCGIYVASRFAT